MSSKISGDIPSVPEFKGDVATWARDLSVYLEQILRDHNEDIKKLHDEKQDA